MTERRLEYFLKEEKISSLILFSSYKRRNGLQDTDRQRKRKLKWQEYESSKKQAHIIDAQEGGLASIKRKRAFPLSAESETQLAESTRKASQKEVIKASVCKLKRREMSVWLFSAQNYPEGELTMPSSHMGKPMPYLSNTNSNKQS